MKASTPFLLLTCAMLGISLLLTPLEAHADVVAGAQCEISPPPQCRDGLDNDGDGTRDLFGAFGYPPDSGCASENDDDEGSLTAPPPPALTCREVIIRVKFPQKFPLPEAPICPECFDFFELLDFRLLLDVPIDQLFESIPDKWEASAPLTSTPVPGVLDDPNIPNFRLHYAGDSEIVGPAVVGEIKLRAPFALPPDITYVGRAFNAQTGQRVTNVGTLSLGTTQTLAEVFDAKLSYSAWSLGTGIGSVYGWDGEICPPWWPWPWPWPWPPPRWDFRFSSYDIDEGGLTRAIPLELGLLIPLVRESQRVTPYVGAGLGYYLLDGDAPGLDDELGAYGVLGADIWLGRRWGLSVEGGYREVGGNLDLSGPTFKAGLGFSF